MTNRVNPYQALYTNRGQCQGDSASRLKQQGVEGLRRLWVRYQLAARLTR